MTVEVSRSPEKVECEGWDSNRVQTFLLAHFVRCAGVRLVYFESHLTDFHGAPYVLAHGALVVEERREKCEGWDSNPWISTEAGLKPAAFGRSATLARVVIRSSRRSGFRYARAGVDGRTHGERAHEGLPARTDEKRSRRPSVIRYGRGLVFHPAAQSLDALIGPTIFKLVA